MKERDPTTPWKELKMIGKSKWTRSKGARICKIHFADVFPVLMCQWPVSEPRKEDWGHKKSKKEMMIKKFFFPSFQFEEKIEISRIRLKF